MDFIRIKDHPEYSVILQNYKNYKLKEVILKSREVIATLESDQQEDNHKDLLLLYIIYIKALIKMSYYALAYKDTIPKFTLLTQKVQLTEQEGEYLDYFQISCLKKMGFYIEALQQFKEILQTSSNQYLKVKVQMKIAKLYLYLQNISQAKATLNEVKVTIHTDFPGNNKILIRYRLAKCKYYYQQAFVSSFKKSVEKLFELIKDKHIVQRARKYLYLWKQQYGQIVGDQKLIQSFINDQAKLDPLQYGVELLKANYIKKSVFNKNTLLIQKPTSELITAYKSSSTFIKKEIIIKKSDEVFDVWRLKLLNLLYTENFEIFDFYSKFEQLLQQVQTSFTLRNYKVIYSISQLLLRVCATFPQSVSSMEDIVFNCIEKEPYEYLQQYPMSLYIMSIHYSQYRMALKKPEMSRKYSQVKQQVMEHIEKESCIESLIYLHYQNFDRIVTTLPNHVDIFAQLDLLVERISRANYKGDKYNQNLFEYYLFKDNFNIFLEQNKMTTKQETVKISKDLYLVYKNAIQKIDRDAKVKLAGYLVNAYVELKTNQQEVNELIDEIKDCYGAPHELRERMSISIKKCNTNWEAYQDSAKSLECIEQARPYFFDTNNQFIYPLSPYYTQQYVGTFLLETNIYIHEGNIEKAQESLEQGLKHLENLKVDNMTTITSFVLARLQIEIAKSDTLQEFQRIERELIQFKEQVGQDSSEPGKVNKLHYNELLGKASMRKSELEKSMLLKTIGIAVAASAFGIGAVILYRLKKNQ